MSGLPASAQRVPRNTADSVNRSIAHTTAESVEYYARHPELIEGRLAALDAEWDTERTLEANASTLVVAGVLGAVLVDRRCLMLSGVVGAFLLQHALQGWCPPLPILRRLGFRTGREIDEERTALKLLRGDFAATGAADDPASLSAARALELARL